jgi:hypothetical protein
MEKAAERLRNLAEDWWKDENTVLAVARVLDDFGVFQSTGDVVSFFFRPWHWKTEILRIVQDVEREAGVPLGTGQFPG